MLKRKRVKELPYLHLYGQKYWHDDAILVGNIAALKELRNAIDNIIQHGEARGATAKSLVGYCDGQNTYFFSGET